MKSKSALENWASAILGVVCLVLLVSLVLRNGVKAGAAKSAVPSVHPPKAHQTPVAPSGIKDELSKYDPEVKLKLLAEIQARPLPEIDRNPFEFPPVKVDTPQVTPGPPVPPPPPPPPALPLKLIGYTDKPGGVKEAIISEEEEVYVVHEGETFAKRFKVLKISPSVAEIFDETTHQTVQLPIAP